MEVGKPKRVYHVEPVREPIPPKRRERVVPKEPPARKEPAAVPSK